MRTFWRKIDSVDRNASYNMALDEAIAESVRKGYSPPTLRFYGWSNRAVSIGRFQKMNEINVSYCEAKGYPIVRRPTGGRAILHNHELTYSFSSRTDIPFFSKGLLSSYKELSHAFLDGLRNMGFSSEVSFLRHGQKSHRSPACFESISFGEISISGKKVVGSAQRRWHDSLLQQGSIPLEIEFSELSNVLNLNGDSNLREKIGCLEDFSDSISIERLKSSISIAFEDTFKINLLEDIPNAFEERLAKELEEKYLSREWTFSR